MKKYFLFFFSFFSCLYSDEHLKSQMLADLPNWWGWCPPKKAEYLFDLVLETKPKVCVEIGVFGGRSLFPIASALKCLNSGIVIGIDPWEKQECIQYFDPVADEAHLKWWSRVSLDFVYLYMMERIKNAALQEQIKIIKCTSEKADPIEQIDLLHIDGNHSEQSSYHDVTKWGPLVKSGGKIIFDDLNISTTKQAVHWLDVNCIKVAEFEDTCIWGVWTKP